MNIMLLIQHYLLRRDAMLSSVYRRFEEMYLLHLQSRRVLEERIKQEVGGNRIAGGLLPN
jgi:hypothetical protein